MLCCIEVINLKYIDVNRLLLVEYEVWNMVKKIFICILEVGYLDI